MEVKKKIIDKCMPLFIENGFKITMDSISYTLRISKRTIYECFRSKEELIYEILLVAYNNMQADFKAGREKSNNLMEKILPVSNLELHNSFALYHALLENARRHYPAVYKLMFDLHIEESVSNFSDMLKEGVKRGIFRKNIDIALVALSLFNIYHIEINKIIFKDFTANAILDNIVLCYLRGIVTANGLELIVDIEKKSKNIKLENSRQNLLKTIRKINIDEH